MPFSNQCCFVTRSFEQSGKSHGAVVDLPSWVGVEIFVTEKDRFQPCFKTTRDLDTCVASQSALLSIPPHEQQHPQSSHDLEFCRRRNGAFDFGSFACRSRRTPEFKAVWPRAIATKFHSRTQSSAVRTGVQPCADSCQCRLRKPSQAGHSFLEGGFGKACAAFIFCPWRWMAGRESQQWAVPSFAQ